MEQREMNVAEIRAGLKLLLRMEKPAPWRLIVSTVWTLPDVLAWDKRTKLLDDIVRYGVIRDQSPSSRLVAQCMELAGRDHHILEEELRERWATQ